MISAQIAGAIPGTVKEWHEPVAGAEMLVPNGEWGDGPWSGEPNKIQWVDAVTGLPCLITRAPTGALCGYAGIYPGHPLHGKSFNDVELYTLREINYSAGCEHSDDGPGQGICHIPEPGTTDDVWWFGFDCGHALDIVPAYPQMGEIFGGSYKHPDYVARGVRILAAQLAAESAHG